LQVCCWRKRGARAVRRGRFSAVAQHAARGTQAQPHRYNAVVAVLELGLFDCAGGVSFFVHACSPGTPGARRLRSPAGGQGAPGSRQPRAWQKAKINDRLGDGRGRLLRSEHQSKHLCQRGRRAGVSAGRRRRAPCAAPHRLLLFPVWSVWCFRACSLPRGVDQTRPPLQDPRPWRQRTRSQRALRWCARMLRRWPQRSGACVARAALRGLRALVRTPSPPPCSHLPAACGVRRVAGGRVRCPCSRRPASDPAGGRHTVRSVVRTLCRRWWRCRRRCPWRRSCWRTTRTSAILARTTCRRYARRPRRCPATSNGTSSGGCRATRPRCSSTP